MPGAADADGRPSWLVHDPWMNRFAHVDAVAREALRHWHHSATAGELIARVNAGGHAHMTADELARLIDFLHASQLTEQSRSGSWEAFAKSATSRRHSLPAWLVHNYLFLRVPLLRPQRLLERTLPAVRLLWSRPARLAAATLGAAGLYLASRQWEHFISTLQGYMTWEGIAAAALALGLVKIAHELGHAYAAVALGCRVHTMGLALVVLAPMPYTDVTDAWRLTDRKKRLLIDSAGMIAETGIAAVALFLWALLPDGPVRSAAFVLSAVSIISSLAINLNPFMRFDGYYLLSEMLGVENLQTRAFALGRWKLRQLLFGLRAPCPEDMPARRAGMLALYAWAVWLYRLVLFTGIALIVYHAFFKALGIVLFAVEIAYFVARPVAGELAAWWSMRASILATRRTKLTLAGAMLAAGGFLVPWSSTVEIPAVLETADLQALYPVRSALVQTVHVRHGQTVESGETIATLVSSDIDDELSRTRISLRMAELQYGRRMVDAADRESSLVLESTIAALKAKIAGLQDERRELTIVAPFGGRIADLNPEVRPGRWVSPRQQIAIVAGGGSLVAKGYAAEADIGRIAPGGSAVFIPEHPSRSRVALRVERIATAGTTEIELPDLASTHTGRIAVNVDERRRLVPATAQYLVMMRAIGPVAEGDLSIRGVALAEGRAESLLARTWRRALGILVRESGA